MPLDILVFLGSVRDSTPPRPARLGHRVAQATLRRLEALNMTPSLIDPLDIDLPTPFKPHFSYAQGKAPQDMENLAHRIEKADGYVMVSPEYNHSMSPALADLLNHFGSSLYAYKPSAIVTYSAGQWGGTRAAVNMRTFLSELGCLPVSAMIHIPKSQDVFTEDGDYISGVNASDWDGYFDRTLGQLSWWAKAAQKHRACDDSGMSSAFTRSPSQRNAP